MDTSNLWLLSIRLLLLLLFMVLFSRRFRFPIAADVVNISTYRMRNGKNWCILSYANAARLGT